LAGAENNELQRKMQSIDFIKTQKGVKRLAVPVPFRKVYPREFRSQGVHDGVGSEVKQTSSGCCVAQRGFPRGESDSGHDGALQTASLGGVLNGCGFPEREREAGEAD
jgi:hypothetical protein